MSARWYPWGLDVLEDVHGRVVRVAPSRQAERNARLIASAPYLVVALLDVMIEHLGGEMARGNGAGKMSEATRAAIELIAYIEGPEAEIHAPAPPAEGSAA